jgi:tripartite-type tricarboxylate transporter receptor subunit TctC
MREELMRYMLIFATSFTIAVAPLASPDLRKRFADMGLAAKHSTPEEFGQFLQSEMTRWKAVLTKKP